jgi:von Willebrand factor type A domain
MRPSVFPPGVPRLTEPRRAGADTGLAMTRLPAILAVTVTFAAAGCAGISPMSSQAGQGATGGSGNVTASTGGSASTGSGTGGVGEANCGLFQFQPSARSADIMMVLDRSGSMADVPSGAPSGSTTTKWQIVVPAMEQIVTATQSSISWGLKTFPEAASDGMSDCAGTVISKPDVPAAASNGPTMNSTIDATTPDGNGTPTGDAIKAATAYLKTVSDANPKYLLLATDGEPTCVGTSHDSDNAGPYAVQAVSDALAAGFPTFVVGIATTKSSDNSRLNQLAAAGGAGNPSTNPLATRYYLANDATTLQAALQAITGQISSCLFPLATPPPVPNDPSKVGVYLGSGMTKVPHDDTRTNGWAYTDDSDAAIEIYGSWCSMIQADGAGALQVIFGCPRIDVP